MPDMEIAVEEFRCREDAHVYGPTDTTFWCSGMPSAHTCQNINIDVFRCYYVYLTLSNKLIKNRMIERMEKNGVKKRRIKKRQSKLKTRKREAKM
jgi:hypothetical protein